MFPQNVKIPNNTGQLKTENNLIWSCLAHFKLRNICILNIWNFKENPRFTEFLMKHFFDSLAILPHKILVIFYHLQNFTTFMISFHPQNNVLNYGAEIQRSTWT